MWKCVTVTWRKQWRLKSIYSSVNTGYSSYYWFLKFFFFFFFLNFFFQRLFLGQRETEHERGRGRERGRHRIGNRLQALSHQPRAQRGARTPGSRDRDPGWSQTLNWLSHLGVPIYYFCKRERQSMSRGGTEREGDTDCKTGSRLRAVSTEPDVGLKLMNCEIMTWAEVGRLTD